MRLCGHLQPLGRACAMHVPLSKICFLPQGHQEAAQIIISWMWVKTFSKFPKWKSKILYPNTCLENTHLFCASHSSTGQMLEFLPNWGRSTENEKQRCLFSSLRTFKTVMLPIQHQLIWGDIVCDEKLQRLWVLFPRKHQMVVLLDLRFRLCFGFNVGVSWQLIQGTFPKQVRELWQRGSWTSLGIHCTLRRSLQHLEDHSRIPNTCRHRNYSWKHWA